jgi:uncharacterized protein YqeY
MSLQSDVMTALKEAMKSKDKVALEALRAIKSALLLVQTSGADSTISEADELKILQRLVKQRKDSAAIYIEQGRQDLAEPELAQVKIIAQFLPEQMSAEELEKIISDIIQQTGAATMKDMGKVMGMASKQLAGKADGKAISTIVKQLLS